MIMPGPDNNQDWHNLTKLLLTFEIIDC